MSNSALMIIVLVVLLASCQRQQLADSELTRATYEQQISQAIEAHDYEAADSLIISYSEEFPGGLYYDQRLIKHALVKYRLKRYDEAHQLLRQVIFECPQSHYLDSVKKMEKRVRKRMLEAE